MNEGTEVKRPDEGACGPGCGCGTTAPGSRGRKVVGIVVVVVVCALVGRAIVKSQGAADEKPTSTGFSAVPAAASTDDRVVTATSAEATAEQAVTNTLREIGAIMELNQVAMGSKGVFIYVAAKGPLTSKVPMESMLAAARKIEPQAGGKIGMFALKVGSPDYEMVTTQVAAPGVLVLVPGGRLVPVTGEITETKLIQGFLSSVQSCGAGGCGPRGCG